MIWKENINKFPLSINRKVMQFEYSMPVYDINGSKFPILRFNPKFSSLFYAFNFTTCFNTASRLAELEFFVKTTKV